MVKNLPANAGDSGWIPGLGRIPDQEGPLVLIMGEADNGEGCVLGKKVHGKSLYLHLSFVVNLKLL